LSYGLLESLVRQGLQAVPMVRVILHTDPFDFAGIDRISILDGPVTWAKKIPFDLQATRESREPYDPKRHFTMDGRVPDVIHRFTRPAGPPLEFLIKDGVIVQVTDSAFAYR
jgi:hypothetical protein